MKNHPERWQVFTEVQFGGATVTLDPDRRYKDLDQLGLQYPVKSFRKAPTAKFRL